MKKLSFQNKFFLFFLLLGWLPTFGLGFSFLFLLQRTEASAALLVSIAGLWVGVSLLLALLMSIKLARPHNRLYLRMQQIAKGELNSAPKTSAEVQQSSPLFDEFSQIMTEIENRLQEIVQFAKRFSYGELPQIVTPYSDRDVVGQAFHNMAKYFTDMTIIATALSERDLRQDFQPKSERDILGNAFLKMQYLRQIMNQITEISEKIRATSKEFEGLSSQMAADAEQASQQVNMVSGTSHQMSERVNAVASAMEEFSSSIREISRNTIEATESVGSAVNTADAASQIITDLEDQSNEIGMISKMIAAITQQTNLLALNATIEAARAGESGKGFSIVASEVKSLAKEIGTSAEEISRKITTIQAGSQEAVTAIGTVARTIAQLREVSSATASSVEQQTVTSKEILQNIADAASGTNDIAEAITDVAAMTSNTSDRAQNVLHTAAELNLLADQLQQLTVLNAHQTTNDLLAYYQQADINWKAYAGTQLTIGLNRHPFTESLRPLISIFEKLTGINVTYMIFSEEDYFTHLSDDLSKGSGTFDVYMTSPMFEWKFQHEGWIEDLTPYFENPKLTDQRWYQREDFYEKVLQANMWDGTIGDRLGRGRWNAIPVIAEFYIQAYRDDLRRKWGLKIPKTYSELLEVTLKAAEFGRHELSQVYGIAERGTAIWATVHAGFLTAFSSYGQHDFDARLSAAINTPEAVKLTALWVEMLQKAGDPTWLNYTWYDVMQNFAAGKFYTVLDADHLAVIYENPAKSTVAGEIGYALPPTGPDGRIVSNMWTWGLGISAFSQHKDAAWLFLLWATSSKTMLEATVKYDSFNPARKSVWEAPAVVAKTETWGSTPGEYREVVNAMYSRYGQVAWTPHPEVTAVGDIWAEAIRRAFQGEDVKHALDDAAAQINCLMAKWQHSSPL